MKNLHLFCLSWVLCCSSLALRASSDIVASTFTISSVNASSPDNCPFLENGTIEIIAAGTDWEFSIDGGAIYFPTNLFSGLQDGNYTVQIRNTISSAVFTYTGNPVVLIDPTCADPCASCHELFSLDWYDGSSGVAWPITNGEASVSQSITITEPMGSVGIDISQENPDGQTIDFSNCGSVGNHFYTATCNATGASNDCDGDPMTIDGQFSYGCSYLTMGMTANTSSESSSFIFDFDKPVRICDLMISDIDFEGSGSGATGSWQDEVEISASMNSTAVNVTASAGSKVYVSNNNTALVNLLAGYDASTGGGLAPTDPAGTVLITTAGYIDQLAVTYSNGPADDGLSDDHAIRISQMVFCPMLPEICNDNLDNDGDGDTDCADTDCPSANPIVHITN